MENKYREEDIQSLDFQDHIKLRPILYFKEIYDEGNLNRLATEVLCHAFDEYFDGKCSVIKFHIAKNYFKVNYNAGMSLELSFDDYVAENIMTKIGACRNEKKHLEVGAEFCLLGIATINAASEKCILKTVSNDKIGEFVFENGRTIKQKVTDSKKKTEEQTELTFYPSKEIFKDLNFDFESLEKKINGLKEKLPNLEIELFQIT